MLDPTAHDWWLALGSALLVGLGSGVMPIALAEATALGAAAVPSVNERIAVVLVFTVGHVAGKALWYWLGTQEARVTRPNLRVRLDRAREVAAAHPVAGISLIFTSATVSLPPFHLTAIAAGIVRAPLVRFVAVAFVGRAVRFGAIAAFPSVVRYLL